MSRRVDRMEQSVSSIVAKIDAVLHKLDDMEVSKGRRKQNMGKILDALTADNDGKQSK